MFGFYKNVAAILFVLLIAAICFGETSGLAAIADSWIVRLSPAAPDPGVALPQLPTTAQKHIQSLKQDPRHGHEFIVGELYGDPNAKKIVFVLPQFHRSPVTPLTWSSLGQAIAEVQSGVDTVITVLVRSHGLRCLGTEGSWRASIRRSPDLDRIALWAYDLEQRGESSIKKLGKHDPSLEPSIRTLQKQLLPYLQRRLLMMDGAGIALTRLRKHDPGQSFEVERFGLESKELNQQAVALARDMHSIDIRLAKLTPSDTAVEQDAVGAMWLNEYPAFASATAQHVRLALAHLAKTRLQLRREGAVQDAQDLGRYIALTQRIVDGVLQLDQVADRFQYEVELERGVAQEVAAPEKNSAKKRRLVERLNRRVGKMQQRYYQVTHRAREDRAAAKIWQRMERSGYSLCAAVMGVNHAEGLAKALQRLAKPPFAVVVLQPYNLDAPDNPK